LPNSSFSMLTEDISLSLYPTIHLLKIMSECNIKKFVFFSSGGAIYGENKHSHIMEKASKNPINFYGWSKLMIESYLQLCKNYYGINYLIIRPSNPYGEN
jgi:UDP-glucose 4-epimerase